MSPTLYRFTSAEGLIHLLDRTTITTTSNNTSHIATSAASQHLEVHTVHGTHLTLNGTAPVVSDYATKEISSFNHLVVDFDETITDHDTTSSFDTLACRVRPGTDYQEPQMSWDEILQAYLDDLEKVDISDLCHLNRPLDPPSAQGSAGEAPTVVVSSPQGLEQEGGSQLHHPQPKSDSPPFKTTTAPKHTIQPPSKQHHLLDPKVRELQCHIDGRTFTPEPELPVPKIPSLQPWIHSQVRKRAVEKVSLDRVYESGNLVGLTRSQIRQFGREHIKLRPGMVAFLKAFVQEYLPDSNLICSNLEYAEEGHETLARRRKSDAAPTGNMMNDNNNNNNKNKQDGDNPCIHHTSGKVDACILTGTDKLHAFRDIQRRYAMHHDLAPSEIKWAYFGDSTTDLGCLVEADLGIIIGKSKSLLSECERCGIQVVDIIERKQSA
ncbi:hypothetical protein BKA57DRAFT_72163 [Linnemannia elongata]|nr:hypothetical protein BKA57DRAFT_72163 [Linnemannia elongata]